MDRIFDWAVFQQISCHKQSCTSCHNPRWLKSFPALSNPLSLVCLSSILSSSTQSDNVLLSCQSFWIQWERSAEFDTIFVVVQLGIRVTRGEIFLLKVRSIGTRGCCNVESVRGDFTRCSALVLIVIAIHLSSNVYHIFMSDWIFFLFHA